MKQHGGFPKKYMESHKNDKRPSQLGGMKLERAIHSKSKALSKAKK